MVIYDGHPMLRDGGRLSEGFLENTLGPRKDNERSFTRLDVPVQGSTRQ